MDTVFLLCVVSTTLQLVTLQNPTNDTQFQPTVEIVTGHSKVFTGDSVRLRCVVPVTPYKSTWSYTWYNGPEKLGQFEQDLVLWNIKTKKSGTYYCKGSRHTSVQDITTIQSLPVEISVDGGWAILDAPSKGVVGFPMNMTCRVRGDPPVHEVILYRDDVEVLRQNGPELFLSNVILENQGQYTCRASWDVRARTRSVISSKVSVQVVEPLTQPTLRIVDNVEMRSLKMLKLICSLDYNVPAPAPPVLYYFYKNGNRLGTPTSDNYSLVQRSKGEFSCNAKVAQFDLSQWSDPESF